MGQLPYQLVTGDRRISEPSNRSLQEISNRTRWTDP